MRLNSDFKLGYVPALDGLRGLAIIAVMMFHAAPTVIQGGFIGVDIFFVLSGFLITSLLVQEFRSMGYINLKYFYVRRILRLFPALLILLIVFCAISFTFLDKAIAQENYIDAMITLVYLSNWARAFDIHPPDLLGHTWSLSIEEQFYIIWPLIFLVSLRITKNIHLVTIFAVALALFSWGLRITLIDSHSVMRIYNGLDTRADALVIGCVLGLAVSSGILHIKPDRLFQKTMIFLAPLSLFFLLVFSLFSNWRDPNMYYIWFFVIELLTTIVILDVVANSRSILRKPLSAHWLIWVGSVSYGLYLWHYPIYRVMSDMGYSNTGVALLGTIMTLIITIISFYSIEKPILKLKKNFMYSMANK